MKRLIQIVAVLGVLVAGAAGYLYFFFDINQFRPRLEAELSRVLGREVKVGDLKLEALKGKVSASDLSIADDPRFSKKPFVTAKGLEIGVELKPLVMDRKLNVTGITIQSPVVELLQDDPGEWNFSSIGSREGAPGSGGSSAGGSGQKMDFSVKLIRISDGRVSVGQPKGAGKPRVFEKVNIEVDDFSPTSAIPFKLTTDTTGAHVKLSGKLGPFVEKNAAATPVDAALNITNFDLSDSGFFAKSTGIDGLVAVDGSVNSTGASVVGKVKVTAERLKLAANGTPAKRTVEFELTVGHNVKQQSGILSAGAIHVGKAQAAISGSYSVRGEMPSVKLLVNGPKMAISELVEILPPLGIVLPAGSHLEGGYAAARLNIEGPMNDLSASGPMGLSDTKLAGFDLGSKLKTIATLTGMNVSPDTDIKTLAMHVNHSPKGTDVEGFELDAPALATLTGGGTVTASHELNFKMRAVIHSGNVVATALGAKGDAGIPFSIQGTSSQPKFVPDVKGIAASTAKEILNSSRINKAIEGSGDVGKAAKGLLEGLLGGKK